MSTLRGVMICRLRRRNNVKRMCDFSGVVLKNSKKNVNQDFQDYRISGIIFFKNPGNPGNPENPGSDKYFYNRESLRGRMYFVFCFYKCVIPSGTLFKQTNQIRELS